MSAKCYGQTSYGDTLYISKDSLKFRIGHVVTCGIGTMPDGNFKYIITNPMGLAGNIPIGKAYSGTNLFIKKIKTIGNERRGFKTYLVVGGGNITNYWIDIEPALKMGELEKENSKPIAHIQK